MSSEPDDFDQLQSAAVALGGAIDGPAISFLPPLPCGFDDWMLAELRYYGERECVQADFRKDKASLTAYSPSGPGLCPFSWKMPAEQRRARPLWSVKGGDFFPKHLAEKVDYLPPFTLGSGRKLPPLLVVYGRNVWYVFTFPNREPVFSRDLSSTFASSREAGQYRKLAVEAVDFFRELAGSTDPNAFPWSYSPELSGALAAARAPLDRHGGTGKLRQNTPPRSAQPRGVSI